MNCEQVTAFLPGLAGGELGEQTSGWVEEHLAGCASCRAQAARHRAVAVRLAELRDVEIEPPPYLAEEILEHVHAERRRRYLPVPPVIPAELVRVVQDNRESIASVASVALAAGAAYALWRTARRFRTSRPAEA